MHHPYQTISISSPSGASPRTQFLLAGSGSKLLCINLSNGTIPSAWQAGLTQSKADENEKESVKENKRRIPQAERPNIITLAVTPSQDHVVVVTGEDKCIRVFSISSEGNLEQLSQRYMPKRPCAVTLMPDGKSIISADKFGDVYALPLLPTPEEDEAARRVTKPPPKSFAPTATDLTVHSKANRKALEAQLKLAKESQSSGAKDTPKAEDPLAFAHELLLGHVSMLTDVVVAELPPAHGEQKPRRYILTSDRDEHIRVSRGPPQAYIIEGFCLGHQEFITKLCLARPDLLISGGGEADIFVWDWMKGEILSRINVSKAVSDVRNDRKTERSEGTAHKVPEITISGIWPYPDPEQNTPTIIVACVGVPALFYFPVQATQLTTNPPQLKVLPLSGNPLDVAILDRKIIVSVDNIHETGSITSVDESTEFKSRLQVFSLENGAVGSEQNNEKLDHLSHLLVEANEMMTTEWHEKSLQALLYGAENLRKRGGEA